MLILAMLIFVSCTPPSNQTTSSSAVVTSSNDAHITSISLATDSAHNITASSNGLYYIVLPTNLLENRSADKAVDDYKSASDFSKGYTDCFTNQDGTMTLVFTSSQYEKFKLTNFSFCKLTTLSSNSSIKNVVFGDDLITSATVYVNMSLYAKSPDDQYQSTTGLAYFIGMYQMACNVPPNNWHTTITVEDDSTHKILTIGNFPEDGMN